jgi:hypothetical protein
MEPSASAVLAFLAAAPVTAPAAEELLLPMASVRSESCGNEVQVEEATAVRRKEEDGGGGVG